MSNRRLFNYHANVKLKILLKMEKRYRFAGPDVSAKVLALHVVVIRDKREENRVMISHLETITWNGEKTACRMGEKKEWDTRKFVSIHTLFSCSRVS